MLEHHIEYYDEEKTIKHYEYWTLNKLNHREDGPAYITYYPDKNIRSKAYYQNNKLHNLKGPATIIYYKDGRVFEETYYINDVQYSKTKWRRLRKERKC